MTSNQLLGTFGTFGLTVAGGFLFGPIGFAAGALLGGFLFGSSGPTIEGPRLGDLLDQVGTVCGPSLSGPGISMPFPSHTSTKVARS